MNDPSSAWINYNGGFYRADSPLLTVSTRGLRYGDGLFETILVQDGRIRLWDFHIDRLLGGMRLLRLQPLVTPADLALQIGDLCTKNGHSGLVRVRLMVFRGEGTLFDASPEESNVVIESAPLVPEEVAFNESGLRVGLYTEGCKACDPLSNLKSNNFLLYAQGARYARDQGWDDCLVLNGHGRVADSCIANVFCIREGVIHTPPLDEGCVAGVMRRFLLERMPAWGLSILDRPVSVEDLARADEIFLTNAVRPIRWVGEFGGRIYHARLARELYELAVKEA